MKRFLLIVSMVCLAMQVAVAQTKTTTFGVRLTIESECAILDVQDLDFGKVGVLTQDLDAETSVIIQCTNNTPYNIAIDSGQNSIINGQRRMVGRDGRGVEYGFFADAARTDPIDASLGNAGGEVGNGGQQLLPIYGRVRSQTTPGPGDYFDIVTLTVSY